MRFVREPAGRLASLRGFPHFARHGSLAAVSFALSLATGCKDVSSYSTKAGESYCGSVVQGPFVRAGFEPDVQLSMTFDAEKTSTSPGVISTSDGLLDRAPLRAFLKLESDPLSTLDFGEGRRKNYLFVTDPKRGSAVTVVVSLMESQSVEVRLVRGGRPDYAPDAASDPPLFGVFPLDRKKGACFLRCACASSESSPPVTRRLPPSSTSTASCCPTSSSRRSRFMPPGAASFRSSRRAITFARSCRSCAPRSATQAPSWTRCRESP